MDQTDLIIRTRREGEPAENNTTSLHRCLTNPHIAALNRHNNLLYNKSLQEHVTQNVSYQPLTQLLNTRFMDMWCGEETVVVRVKLGSGDDISGVLMSHS